MMAFDAYKILDELETGSMIDLIAPCMDDYLYIIDLKNDTLRISQSAVERFMLPDKFMNDATKHLRTLVYEKDRKLLENHKRKIYDGKEKSYNVLCRLISGKNSPVWISCRGEVIHDNEGKPHYIIGCMNETGTRQRADNISGLLGEKEMASYLYSQPKEKLSGYLIQIGIDDFGIINNVHGQIYGNYILKRVAECIAECLSGGQKIYHLVLASCCMMHLSSKVMKEKYEKEKLLYTSNTDELTGCLNRHAYETDINKLDLKKEWIYISLDLNCLKRINDTYGHAAGDEMICAAAACMTASFGEFGKVYRIGGDEFAVIVAQKPDEFDSMKNEFDSSVSKWRGKNVDSMTISYGCVGSLEEDWENIYDIAKEADRRMYESKARYYRDSGIDRRK